MADEIAENAATPGSPVEDRKRKLDELEADDQHVQYDLNEKLEPVESSKDGNCDDNSYDISAAKRSRLDDTTVDGSAASENGFHMGTESETHTQGSTANQVEMCNSAVQFTVKSSVEIPEISNTDKSPACGLMEHQSNEKHLINSRNSGSIVGLVAEVGSEASIEIRCEENVQKDQHGIWHNSKSSPEILQTKDAEVHPSTYIEFKDAQKLSMDNMKGQEPTSDDVIAEKGHEKILDPNEHPTVLVEEDAWKPSVAIKTESQLTPVGNIPVNVPENLLPESAEQAKDTTEQYPPSSEFCTTMRKVEVPNDKVGVLIGKSGDTIRYLQYHSGAKIQITRDFDVDPSRTTRPVELIGSLESVTKAEKLIKDVIAEAEAGGSPSLVARGFTGTQSTGSIEQDQMQVPNEKVGVIIGRGGENIKNMQNKSGARIQLLPQVHEGEPSNERTIRLTGDRKQLESAKELVKEIMNQPTRFPYSSGGYSQQNYRPRGPGGPRSDHPAPYDYQHRGPYPSQPSQYPSGGYGSYPSQNMPPRGGFTSGWDQRAPSSAPHGGGYGYYSGPGGSQGHYPPHGSTPGSSTPQAPYYRPQSGAEYGQPASYSQAPASYGQGFEEPRYDQHSQAYTSQTTQQQGYPQGGPAQAYPYPPQTAYGGPSPYVMQQPQGPPNPYAPPRADSYQGHYPASQQSYAANFPPQQTYSYPVQQQSYPTYGDGYSQPQPQSYPQQQGVYAPVGQSGYTQGGYVQYSSTPAPVYSDPNPAAAATYQAPTTDPPLYTSNAAGTYPSQPTAAAPQAYAQPVVYDTSGAQSGGYGVQSAAPTAGALGKSVSPQPQPQPQSQLQPGYPQYDSSQMYTAQR